MRIPKWSVPEGERLLPAAPRPVIAQDLMLWRARHALSQAQLARLLGVQPLAVARWEANARRPPDYLRLALERLTTLLRPRYSYAEGDEADIDRILDGPLPPPRRPGGLTIRVVDGEAPPDAD